MYTPPKLHPFEEERQKVLNSLNILDTLPDPLYNGLIELIQKLYDVPIALVSLIDNNRQWFKACIGLDILETSRDISFCGHAILQNSIFIVNDASIHIDFEDHPCVTGESHIRFYAGCVISVKEMPIGTICIIDTKPRDFTREDLKYLRIIADVIERKWTTQRELITIKLLIDFLDMTNTAATAEHNLRGKYE